MGRHSRRFAGGNQRIGGGHRGAHNSFGLRKLLVRVQATIDRAEPILDTARRVLDDTAPKFAAATTDAVEVVRLSREQTERLSDW